MKKQTSTKLWQLEHIKVYKLLFSWSAHRKCRVLVEPIQEQLLSYCSLCDLVPSWLLLLGVSQSNQWKTQDVVWWRHQVTAWNSKHVNDSSLVRETTLVERHLLSKLEVGGHQLDFPYRELGLCLISYQEPRRACCNSHYASFTTKRCYFSATYDLFLNLTE